MALKDKDLDLGGVDDEGGEETVTAIQPAPAAKGRGKGGRPPGKKPNEEIKQITVQPLETKHVIIPIIGNTKLIVNNFSEKSKKQMLDKQMQVPQQKKEKKIPTNDFLGSLYVISGDPKLVEKGTGKSKITTLAPGSCVTGFPANALKNVAVAACTAIQGVYKTEARMAFHVNEYYLPILDPKTGKPAIPYMRDDVVRLAGPRPVADIRFRATYDEWMLLIPVEFNIRMIDESRLVHLYNNAGFGVGIGEWRPECDGPYGRFHVDLAKQKMARRAA